MGKSSPKLWQPVCTDRWLLPTHKAAQDELWQQPLVSCWSSHFQGDQSQNHLPVKCVHFQISSMLRKDLNSDYWLAEKCWPEEHTFRGEISSICSETEVWYDPPVKKGLNYTAYEFGYKYLWAVSLAICLHPCLRLHEGPVTFEENDTVLNFRARTFSTSAWHYYTAHILEYW